MGKGHADVDDEMAKVNKIQVNIDMASGSHISRECNGNKNEKMMQSPRSLLPPNFLAKK